MKSIKKSDNNGFTLIEVLVAVLVLAVVVVPLLHSFVSSHRINAKGKQYMRATTLAQDEMEVFEKEKIADLVDGSSGFVYDEITGPDSDGCYTFVRLDVNHDSSSASKFDVKVTLDPERSTATSRYHDTNTQSLFYMNTIGSKDSAVYVQSIRNASTIKGYDDNIYEYFNANKSAAGAGNSWGIEQFNNNLARRIKVKIYEENNGLNIATVVKVTYEYVLCNNNPNPGVTPPVMPTGYETYSEESIIFNSSAQGIDDEGNLPELKNVYLFYAPRYKGYAAPYSTVATVNGETNTYKTNEDWIVIENEAKLPVDVYLIRQDTFLEGSTTEVEPVPLNYQPKLEIHDGMDANHTIGHYFTNLNIDSTPGLGVGQQINFSSLKDYGNLSRIYSNTEARSVIDAKPLNGEGSIQTEAKDRIYTMTVEVWAHDTMDVRAPIVTMTGSKLE